MVVVSQQSLALGLVTTGPDLGLGLADFQQESRYQAWSLGRDLSTHLHMLLAEFLLPQRWSQLNFLAVARGPGSFTGTRIGVVTARTLAQQLKIPLFPISTLAALAWSHIAGLENQLSPQDSAQEHRPQSVAVTMPAQQGAVFAAVYDLQPAQGCLAPILAETVLTVEDWEDYQRSLPPSTPQLLGNVALPAEILCQAMLALAYRQWQQGDRPHWSQALPFYGAAPSRPGL